MNLVWRYEDFTGAPSTLSSAMYEKLRNAMHFQNLWYLLNNRSNPSEYYGGQYRENVRREVVCVCVWMLYLCVGSCYMFMFMTSCHVSLSKIPIFIMGNGYPSANIELLAVIFRPIIKLIYFLYLCKWGLLELASLSAQIRGLMVVAGDYVWLSVYVFANLLSCTIMWACALEFILETMYDLI